MMGQRKYRDISIRGVVYATAQEAAAALGVSDATVMLAARNGTLETCGTGRSHPRPMPCHVGGRTFPTVARAAKHFKCSKGAIYKAINDGNPDRIGKPLTYNGATSKPFVYQGHSWPSHAQAERDLGLPRGFIRQVRRRNSRRGQERLLAAVMRYSTKTTESGRRAA
jgi:hypothetical protein